MKKWRRAAGVILQKTRALPWPLLSIFLFLATAIAVSAYVYFQQQKNTVIHEQTIQLRAIAELKSAEIEHWLQERRGDARLVMENRMLAAELLAYLADRAAGPRRESIRKWMASLRKSYRYRNVILLDSSRQIALVLSPGFSAVGAKGLDVLEAVRRRKDVVVSDLHISAAVPFPHLDVALPLLAENRVAGYVLLRIDPADFLFPMIQSWPTPSPSAETLLAERQGDSVLFLNELRHRRDTAMKLRLPLKQTDLPAAQGAEGRTGATTGHDYRGVAVWAVIRPVAGTSWFIVAKVDRDEMELPIRRSALAIFLVALSFILAAALTTLFLWQRQDARFRLGQLEAQQASEEKFRQVFETANVGKSITQLSGEIQVNKAFCVMLGYGREELQQKKWQELTPPDEIAAIQKMLEPLLQGRQDAARFTKRYIHKNGSIVWGDVSVAVKRDPAGRPLHFITTVVDITERKQVEKTLSEIIDNAPFGAYFYELQPEERLVFVGANRAADSILGVDNRQFIGKTIEEAFPPLKHTDIPDAYRRAAAHGVRFDTEQVEYADGGIRGAFEVHAFQTSPNRMAAFFFDITERKRAEESIRESATLLRSILDATPFPIAIVDVQDNQIDFWSRSALAIFGHTAPTAAAWYELAYPDPAYRREVVEQWKTHLEEAQRSGQTVNTGEYRVACHDGSVRICELHATFLADRLIVTFNDITKRKQAEERLKENHMLIRSAGVMTKLGGWNVNLTENRSYWSDEVAAIHEMPPGYSPLVEEGINFYAPEWRERITKVFTDCAQKGIPYNEEMEIITATGKRLWVHTIGEAVRDEKGMIFKVQGAFQDITARKKVEEELQLALLRVRKFIDANIVGVVIADANGKIVETNDYYLQMIGFSREEFEKGLVDWRALTPPEWLPADERALRELSESGKCTPYEKEYVHRDGSRVHVYLVDAQLPGPEKLIAAFAIDITARKQAENEIRNLNDELEQRVLQRTSQLEAANKELEAFSYSVSHDLRAPLRAIDGFSRIVVEEYASKLDNEGRRLLGVIMANTGKMAQLIDDLLAFSRLSRQKMASAPVNLAALAEAIFSELISQEKGRHIEFKTGPLPVAIGDRSMLRQVLQNLLANAIKFTRPRAKARIEFSGERDGGESIYRIRDNGVGFDMNYANKLFGVFQRLHGADEFEGTGVGLAIVQRIVLRHGGRVWAESAAKGGATFHFSLPDASAEGTAAGTDERPGSSAAT